MVSKKKTVTRHKTATIGMVAVLILSLITYFVSEKVLRTAMLKPIKRDQVDFAKVLTVCHNLLHLLPGHAD